MAALVLVYAEIEKSPAVIELRLLPSRILGAIIEKEVASEYYFGSSIVSCSLTVPIGWYSSRVVFTCLSLSYWPAFG